MGGFFTPPSTCSPVWSGKAATALAPVSSVLLPKLLLGSLRTKRLRNLSPAKGWVHLPFPGAAPPEASTLSQWHGACYQTFSAPLPGAPGFPWSESAQCRRSKKMAALACWSVDCANKQFLNLDPCLLPSSRSASSAGTPGPQTCMECRRGGAASCSCPATKQKTDTQINLAAAKSEGAAGQSMHCTGGREQQKWP